MTPFQDDNDSRGWHIGLEMEFSLVYGDSKLFRMPEWFHDHRRPQVYGNHGVITDEGFERYWDNYNAEIAGPPITVDSGFASRFREVSERMQQGFSELEEITSYVHSIQWNFRSLGADETPFFQRFLIPFSAFMRTPFSSRTRIKEKAHSTNTFRMGGRTEVRGDGMVNTEQLQAGGLFLGAALHGLENTLEFPYVVSEEAVREFGTGNLPEYLGEGLETMVNVYDQRQKGREISMTAREYLSAFHEWLSPCTLSLATDEESGLLEAFITGKRPLEIDQQARYETALYSKEHLPFSKRDRKESPAEALQAVQRKLPISYGSTEADLIGRFVTRHAENVSSLGWNSLVPSQNAPPGFINKSSSIQSPDTLYRFCEQFLSD